uniref:Uncharacterized protein n=1 Tax=Quercus lobata TaxID=97700 RepID=A0A7N2N744_QUELO
MVTSKQDNHLWVPWLPTFKPKPKNEASASSHLMVSQLIDHAQHAWRSNMVLELFDHESAKAILSIPIPIRSKPDKALRYTCCWGFNPEEHQLATPESIIKLVFEPPKASTAPMKMYGSYPSKWLLFLMKYDNTDAAIVWAKLIPARSPIIAEASAILWAVQLANYEN